MYKRQALAIIAKERPDLVEQAIAPFIDELVRAVTNYKNDFTGPAEGFIRVVVESAPVSWRIVLARLDPAITEINFSECLTKSGDHLRTTAVLIESAIELDGDVGDMARRLRIRYPKASALPTKTVTFTNRHGRSGRRA